MVIKEVLSKESLSRKILKTKPNFVFYPYRTVEWIGGVNQETYQTVLSKIKRLAEKDPILPINLIVTSPGGATGVAMSFYDMIKKVFRIPINTIGSGDVDSSGLVIFLAGARKFITKNTTIFLHMGGRVFDDPKRLTSLEMKSIFEEDSIKDAQYASVVANESGILTPEKVLEMMKDNTVLTAEKAVNLGLAEFLLE